MIDRRCVRSGTEHGAHSEQFVTLVSMAILSTRKSSLY